MVIHIMRTITPEFHDLPCGGKELKTSHCGKACVSMPKGAEYPIECDDFAQIGSQQVCNVSCLE